MCVNISKVDKQWKQSAAIMKGVSCDFPGIVMIMAVCFKELVYIFLAS